MYNVFDGWLDEAYERGEECGLDVDSNYEKLTQYYRDGLSAADAVDLIDMEERLAPYE